jgi:hypothetical protein
MRPLIVILVLAINASAVFADVAPPPRFGGIVPEQEWWSEQDAGWYGGLLGGSLGMVGAVFGVTAGLGKARSFILALAIALCGFGIILLTIGAIAVAWGQPYHVYFLFFVIGGVLTFVMGLNYPMLKRRYDQTSAI